MTVVEGNPKTIFSLATPSRYRRERNPYFLLRSQGIAFFVRSDLYFIAFSLKVPFWPHGPIEYEWFLLA